MKHVLASAVWIPRLRRNGTIVLAATLLPFGGACTAGGSDNRSPPTASAQRASPSPSSDCRDKSPSNPTTIPEVQGYSTSGVTLFGLGPFPVRLGKVTKIVWRMTGSGPITIAAISPNGDRIVPDWGPEEHVGSNWDRPGDEWGTGFRFTEAGCWIVRAARGKDEAAVGILVVNN